MIIESNEIMVGIDLGYDYSQLTIYSQGNTEPVTVSMEPDGERYQIPTPRDLFPLVDQGAELGTALLSNFLKDCLETQIGVKNLKKVNIMATMKTMKASWARAFKEAMEMLGIPREQVFLQTHLESFYYYVLNQRKELWAGKSALFEYEQGEISAYELSVEYNTKPALVYVGRVSRLFLDQKTRGNQNDEQWNKARDQLFLNQCRKMFQDKNFSSAFLLGDQFDQEWAKKSLQFLCQKRHVFLGENLYSKGACYGVMQQRGAVSMGNYLFAGPDMIEQNLSMSMYIKGEENTYQLISAGVSWYMACHVCEFILDDIREIRLYSKNIRGEELQHTIQLTDLPERPNRATRIHMEVEFTSLNRCRIRLDDLGLGSLHPSSEKKWESVIEF